jgi:hypothetical protein
MKIGLTVGKADTDALDVAFETDFPTSGKFFVLKL